MDNSNANNNIEPNQNNSNIFSWNCRGLRNKKYFLEKLIWENTPLVIALQELKLKKDTKFNTNLSNYSYIDELLETDGNAQGGVGFYIHKDVTHHRIKLNTKFQAIAIHAFLHKRITICNIYINPQQNFTQADLEHLTKQLPKPYILTGDFNSHNTLWYDHWNETDDRGKTVENFILNNDINILDEDEHTYEQFRNNGTIYKSHIDLTLITPDLQPDLDWTTHDEDNGGSDHVPIQIAINKTYNFNKLTRWNFQKANWEKYRELAVFDKPIKDFSDIQELTDYIVKTINLAGEKTIGKMTVGQGKTPKPWWNFACKRAVKNKKKTYRKAKCDPTTENQIEYRKNNAIAVRTIRNSKQEHWNKFLESINSFTASKDVWRKIQSMKGKNKTKPVSGLKIDKNKIVDEKKDIANELGKSFQNISNGQNSSETFQKYREGKDQKIDFSTNSTLEYNISIKISELKNILKTSRDTAPGEDGIPYIMIRQLSENSLKYLLEFYNTIFRNDVLPEKWKEAIIIPILKPGKEPTDTSSYRPIALISCLGKILEKILNKRLMWYLEKNNLIDKSQCGFRQGRSAPDHLTRLTSDIQEAFVNNRYHISIFLDLEKAYDTVWKQVILNQLQKFNIKGHLAFYVQNFLENRSIKVKVGNNLSENFYLDLGVPQGSSLSVTLFLIAINTILDFIPQNFQKSLFVDDCRISMTTNQLNQTTTTTLQNVLNNLEIWAAQTGFKFSKGKSEILICHRKIPKKIPVENLPKLTLDKHRIKVVNTKKFLGVWFDDRLTWTTHITYLKDECSRALKLLKTLAFSKTKTDTKILLRIYKSMILSKLDYGCQAYGTASTTELKRLDPTHHQALRLCLGAFHTTRIESLYVESNIHSLFYRRKILGIKYFARTQTIAIQNTICNLGDKRRKKMFENSVRYESLAIKIGFDMQELQIDPGPKGPFGSILKQNVSKTPPWIIPKINVCFHMENFPKTNTPTPLIKAEFLKHKHDSNIDLYTDGSKIGHTGVGAGIAILLEINKTRNIFNQSGKTLCKQSTILSAELEAISMGLQVIAKSSNKTIAVYSDSKGALQSILQYDPKNPLAQEIQAKLSRAFAYNNKVIFCWVPSHREIIGNHYADKQAYQASKKNITKEKERPVVAKDLNAYIAEQGKKWLQNQWNAHNDQFENKLYFVDGEIGERKFHSFKTRLDEIKYNRIRLGHSRLTNKHLAAGEEPPICIMCDRPITIKHIFTNCPLYAEARKRFFEHNQQNFPKILERKSFKDCNKVINFLKYTKIYDEI